MNHNQMTMATPTAVSEAMPSSTGSPMGGGGGMSMGGTCKISMLWNWYTVDSCFIARSWRITSKGMFAGSCIGVILLVMVLEFLRRAGKEYDRFIVAQHAQSLAPPSSSSSAAAGGDDHDPSDATVPSSSNSSDHGKGPRLLAVPAPAVGPGCPAVTPQTFRPSVVQQATRALLHMLQFAVAYFVMLLAMYYNGYIIICIFIGSYLGYFVFGWETLAVGGGNGRLEEEATVCCG